MNNGKRLRDPEDAVYLDNFHSEKRYLSEVMASSLNGLTFGESQQVSGRVSSPSRFDPMESPARTDSVNFCRDDLAVQYSPMSEDNDEYASYRMMRFNVSPQHAAVSQSEQAISNASPGSPQRYQKTTNCTGIQFGSPSFVSHTGTASSSVAYAAFPLPCAQGKQRNPDTESRFPPSPSDPCQSADLRRAALLRLVQMRTQPSGMPSFEVPVGNEHGTNHIHDPDDSSSPFAKTLAHHSDYSFESSAREAYSAQPMRSSGRVRSLLLDECPMNSPLSSTKLPLSSQQDCKVSAEIASNEDDCCFK